MNLQVNGKITPDCPTPACVMFKKQLYILVSLTWNEEKHRTRAKLHICYNKKITLVPLY